MDPVFTLATDLDGTFLGGSEMERQSLYNWIEMHRSVVELIFVTGRDLPFIEGACAEGIMPWPDFVVGDVGTTIAVHDWNTNRLTPDDALEAPIAALWGDGVADIQDHLDAAPGVEPQDVVFRHRMSYHYDPEHFDPATQKVIEAAGFDCLISDNRFLDILPKGVSKGPSLLRLLEARGRARDAVLVAGDTLNDLSLFETGLKGVAVGNSERGLLEKIAGRENVHVAQYHGAGGVLEAIDSFGFADTVARAIETEMEVPA
ncbi:HAD family hydrolase [Hwanghaeella grinnelliae]|nr:HAD family hydrolase [Hwanghaeella grinnelliae]